MNERRSSASRPGEPACIFCELLRMKDGPENLILFRGPLAFVMLNKYPYTNGHLMIVPIRHVGAFEALEEEEGREVLHLAQRAVVALKEKVGAHGFNLGMNLGRAAGTGIDDHVHLHVVPRWEGDSNFMPVVGEVRVIPQHLEETFKTLLPAFR